MEQIKRTINIGVIGCGEVAEKYHIPALLRLPGVKVVAVADLDTERVKRIADRFRIAGRCRDFHELLRIQNVDIIAILVPPAGHAEIALAAFEVGRHLFIEKPPALCMDDMDRLIEKSKRSPFKVMIGFNLRWHHLVRRARDLIRKNTLGKIHGARTIVTSTFGRQDAIPLWRRHRILGGGVLIDLAVHHFDLMRFLLDREIEEICAASRSEDQGDDNYAVVTARLEGGILMNSFFSQRTTYRNEIEIYGEKGCLSVSCYRFDGLQWSHLPDYPDGVRARMKNLTRTLLELPGGFARMHRGGHYAASFCNQWRHYLDAVRYDRAVACPPEEGRHAMKAVFAALESARTGLPVRLTDSL